MKRIEEFEGLRGLLAMWVFLTHIVAGSGYPWGSFKQPARTFVNGVFAVDVFMILSGFVISMLITTRRESYGIFIARRFLRLYPAYLICLIAAIILCFVGVIPKTYNESQFVHHLLAHLTMLHGAVPNSILRHAAGSFLDPGWSISTEWQFYLLVPVFFIAFRSRPVLAWSAFIAISFLASRGTNHFGSWDHAAFLPMKLNLFAVGILSYFIFKWVDENKETVKGLGSYITPTLLGFTLMFSVVTSQVGLYVWLLVFGSVLAVRVGGTAFDKSISKFLQSKFLQWLGTISYSIYLSHILWVSIAIKLFKNFVPGISNFSLLLGVTALSIPATLIVSHLLYRFVELPAIQFGKGIDKRPIGRDAITSKA